MLITLVIFLAFCLFMAAVLIAQGIGIIRSVRSKPGTAKPNGLLLLGRVVNSAGSIHPLCSAFHIHHRAAQTQTPQEVSL